KYHLKIFNVFQKLESDKNSTGIGLSIVEKIIDRYGGKIWLTSELKKGSTFFFTLNN
ncbi:MAG TPA: two-component sensor histidine kinase, partial [Tenacibaculum sp.]|nr:two-component sensor histidine kinase [Tenacibaculum sp.]